MQYLGAKSKWGRHIVDEIERWRRPGSTFVDVFAGALNVVRWAAGPRAVFDGCAPLIVTLQAVRDGWDPPSHVDESTYQRIKANQDPRDPLTAFAMFGCSYGGKWGGGYARSRGHRMPDGSWQYPNGRSFAAIARRGIIERVAACEGAPFLCADYRDHADDAFGGACVYLDPPYRSTEAYGAMPPFDSDHFWRKAYAWHRNGADVFVSEGEGAAAPSGWVVLREWSRERRLGGRERGALGKTAERLFVRGESRMGRAA